MNLARELVAGNYTIGWRPPHYKKYTGPSLKKGIYSVGNWIKKDPVRAVQSGLAAYAAYTGYQGGYIPLDAVYHATRAYDRKKPYRKRFRLTRGYVKPTNKWLRRRDYRRKRDRWLPYWEWKAKQNRLSKRRKPYRSKFYTSFNKYSFKHVSHRQPFRWQSIRRHTRRR